ncbi:MAG: aldehyde dehydrogenase family protein, partial [Actinomycetes bacterium]
MNTIPHFVNGQRVEVSSDRHLSVFNPATAEAIGALSVPSTAFLDEVVAITVAAAAQWRTSSLSRRTAVLFAFRELLVRHTDELALLITTEQGKTLADARGELARGLENVEYACGLADHLKGEFASQVADGVDVHSFREPIGVVLAITPFNFPAMVPLWMLANAIAAGNGVVLKPSERDPSAAVRLAELLIEAGLPAGVLNVVHGDRHTVEY